MIICWITDQDDGYSRKEADEQTKGFLDSVHKYSNLLIEKGYQQYGFIHLTFEEYLAGFGLALEGEEVLFAKIPELLINRNIGKKPCCCHSVLSSAVNSDPKKANAILEETVGYRRIEVCAVCW